MKIVSYVLSGLIAAGAGSSLAAAQDTASMPKVLQVTREFIKPGKSGAMHDRSESNFVQAMARAKFPTHYIALSSLSGKTRALYLTGYPSFAAWQKDNDTVDKNSALSAELDRLSVADGELLDSMDQFVFYFDEDTSYRPNADLSNARYMEVSSFHVRPGHDHDWTELAKMVIAAHQKAGTSAHWATYELAYGGGDEYVILSADKSMADIDQGFAEGKQFEAAMGEDGMKKFGELAAATIESSDSELFTINPRQSYAPEEWIKANPEFWKPKAPAAPAAKPAPDKKSNP
ncbi:MAG TPA: hypothetical protein VGF96_13505 [Terracidiphilus sp.]|jgi:hypothetical protein